jgi:FkbM family methyltransferase
MAFSALSFFLVIIVPLQSYDEPNVSLIQINQLVRVLLTGNNLNKVESRVHIYKECLAPRKGYHRFKKWRYGSHLIAEDLDVGFLEIFKGRFTNAVVKAIDLNALVSRANRRVGLLQMDIQGDEGRILQASEKALRSRAVTRLIVGSHSPDIHNVCAETLSRCGYDLEHNLFETTHQPDGIIAAKPRPE